MDSTVSNMESTIYGINFTNATTPAPVYLNNTLSEIGDNWSRRGVGITLAVCGNMLISFALSVQKYAHNRLGDEGKYYVDKWWWLGMVMMVIGESGNFMAYGFAPASLVAPLGSVAVLSNVLIAFVFLREPVTPQSILGVTMVIIGSVFLITFSAMGHPSLSAEKILKFVKAWTFLVYIAVEALALVFLFYLYFFRKMEHMIILLLFVALIASVTIISAKGVSSLLSESLVKGIQIVMTPIFWVMLLLLPITTVVQIRFLNRAMQLYNVSDVVPVNFIFFTVSAILAGTMFYQEFYGVPFLRVFMFIFGCFLSFIGVYIISHCKNNEGFGCCKKVDDDHVGLTGEDKINSDYSTLEGSNEEMETKNGIGNRLSIRLLKLLKRTEKVSPVQNHTTEPKQTD